MSRRNARLVGIFEQAVSWERRGSPKKTATEIEQSAAGCGKLSHRQRGRREDRLRHMPKERSFAGVDEEIWDCLRESTSQEHGTVYTFDTAGDPTSGVATTKV